MQVLSYRSGKSWRVVEQSEEDELGKAVTDEATAEITRVLSDCFRCNNLIVLTGLGTSLHVNVKSSSEDKSTSRQAVEGKRLAPTMADLWKEVQSKNEATFEKVFLLSKCPEKSRGNIETLLSYCKIALDYIDAAEDKVILDAFIASAEAIVRDLVRFLTPDDDLAVHADFLRRLARRSSRKLRTKIFTTNYDLCFEYAARHGRYVVIDGFSHTNPQVFDSLFFSYDIVKRDSNPESHDFIPNVFHLYKLHGSVDWTKNQKTGEIEKDDKTNAPILVYPRNTKYELAFEQPYLEMMSAFQAAIRQPDTGLLILGFGFNDNHIAEPILSAINSNLHLKVVVCDPALGPWIKDGTPAEGAETKNPHLSKIRYLIEYGDARLALISSTFKEIVPYLPDIAAETDLEQHVERVRMLRSVA